jgi:hypothetical protein
MFIDCQKEELSPFLIFSATERKCTLIFVMQINEGKMGNFIALFTLRLSGKEIAAKRLWSSSGLHVYWVACMACYHLGGETRN